MEFCHASTFQRRCPPPTPRVLRVVLIREANSGGHALPGSVSRFRGGVGWDGRVGAAELNFLLLPVKDGTCFGNMSSPVTAIISF